ncbi:MAG: type II secretion system F family protein [Actinobacteria bacterium]|jgi:hypothetical protein|nr:type II secretion system F family protein [Actinomycetota bacterium]
MSPQLSGLVAGLLAAVTLLTLTAAFTPSTSDAVPVARRRLRETVATHRRGLIAVAVALIAVAATRMVVVGVAVGVALWLTPTMVAGARQRTAEQQMLEAVHLWLLQLRTVLAAGSGLEQAMIEVATLQPDHSPLAPASARLANRVERLGPIRALRGFAAEVDNHIADAAVTVLVNALRRQNVGVADALDGLLEWAEQDVRQRRDIDARLASVRTQRWMIVGIFAALAAYFTAANPQLMAIYTTALGQAVLAGILAVAGLCVWMLERMAGVDRPQQFFAHRQGAGG